MKFSIPIPSQVLDVHRALLSAGFQSFLVGGCVRDLLRNKVPNDFDLCTSARPEEVQKLFKRVIPTGIEHGTVTVLIENEHVEVTTFRSESEYLDGRRPSAVKFETDVEADLSRRDFTMNAMAYDPVGGTLVDPFHGQEDLKNKTIRCVGLALDRFLEDGLRPLRAVRFATTLDFELEEKTKNAIEQTLHVFQKVAMERVQQEFEKLLLAPAVEKGLRLLGETKLLSRFFPEAHAQLQGVSRLPPRSELRLAALLLHRADAKDILVRLKFPSKVAQEVAAIIEHQALPNVNFTEAQLRRFLAKATPERTKDLLILNEALGANVTSLQERIDSILRTNPPLEMKAVALNGQEIMSLLQIKPSKIVGDASKYLFELVLEDPTQNTKERLEIALKSWFQQVK
jgi:tRNA nucleotidyltransferase (CCA-adding enzyme)